MFFHRKSQFSCSSIHLTFILFILSDASISIANEINDLRQRKLENSRDAETVFETICHNYRYPVKTRLELTSFKGTVRFRRNGEKWTENEYRSSSTVRKAGEKEVANFVHEMLSVLEEVGSNREPGFYTGWIEQDTRNSSTKITGTGMTRFRRNDKTQNVTQNGGSSKDYMSTYYAQRKAIMDKFKSQQREIMERLKKTRTLIAETRKLKESRKIDSGNGDASQNELPDAPSSNITYRGSTDSTIAPNTTINSIDFTQTTSTPSHEIIISNSTIVTNTQNSSLNNTEAIFDSSDYEAADYSTEVDSSNSTLPLANETFHPIVDDKTDMVNRPDVDTLEKVWRSESVNLIPQNEVDSNLTEEISNGQGQERDNDTVIFNLGGHLVNPSSKNDSAFDQLEKMFLWEVPVGSERIPRFNNDSQARIVNAIPETDQSDNSSKSTESLRFMVEIKSSPGVEVTKNIKNVRTSTTTYRNSTHEIVEIDGVINSTKKINATDSLDVDSPFWKNPNFTDPGVASSVPEVGGGARESEWCEECPHDYRWGNCEGTLFYQHNIFLRNRGPSAIDAIFGMNVQGPVSITCVEAIRFNQTRGIVSLHSGGQGHDFAKLRIRGFQGEGFSYILKVWGVANEE